MIQEHIVKVGMADLQVIRGGGKLRTTGLGSCVGVTLFDPRSMVAGMAHVMLPSSDIAREQPVNPGKYADLAVPEMYNRMIHAGANARAMQAKMAGGAQMFALTTENDLMRIGYRNAEAVRAALAKLSIPIVAFDTGGNYGRTIELDTESGILHIRSVNKGTKEI